jgi:hypothetical protein
MLRPAQTGFSPVFIDVFPVIPEGRFPVLSGPVFPASLWEETLALASYRRA